MIRKSPERTEILVMKINQVLDQSTPHGVMIDEYGEMVDKTKNLKKNLLQFHSPPQISL